MIQFLPVIETLGGILGPVVEGMIKNATADVGEKIAGKFGGMIAETLGIEPTPEAIAKADPAAVEKAAAAIVADPEKLAALVALSQEETKRLTAELADVQDAREAEKARLASGSATAWTPSILSFLAFGGFAAVSYAILGVRLDANGKELAIFLAGQWSGFVFLSFQYFFGSSPGSKAKDGVIGEALRIASKK